MTTSPHRPLRAWVQSKAILFIVAALAMAMLSASTGVASARHSSSKAANRKLAHSLHVASKHRRKADRKLVASAKSTKRCLGSHRSHPKRCRQAVRKLQRAGRQLAVSDHRLAATARSSAGTFDSTGAPSAEDASSTLQAPQIAVAGQTLSWNRIGKVNTYVFVRKVPGQADEYSVISGTSITPPAVMGATVRYSVRTAVRGSLWANERSISYGPADESQAPRTAPAISVSGQTLTWNAIGKVNTYVFVRKVPGKADEYSAVSGNSIKPPVVPGATVRYSVRTAVNGSAWASEVAIEYPSSTPTPAPSSPPEGSAGGGSIGNGAGTPGSFELGLVTASNSSEEPNWIKALAAHTVRMEFSINTPASQLEHQMEMYARAGLRPILLAGFAGRLPSTGEAQNLAGWAAEFGPGGSFWQGKSFPADTAVTRIEFGNETSYSYQFSDNSSSGMSSRGSTYASRLKDAQLAIQAVNPGVGLLAQGDDGNSGSSAWVNGMFSAVPDLGQRIAGWTIHPYGPEWQRRMDRLISQTQAAGAPSTLPMYVTEWGLATDNGHCLSDNYGWNKCMSYDEAASTLNSTVSGMRARYGSRLAALYLYQAHDRATPGGSTDRELYFGALQSNNASKGAFTAMVKTLCGENP